MAGTGYLLSLSATAVCCATPHSITVSVTPIATLPDGTYTGQVVVTSQSASMSMTIPVMLIIGTGLGNQGNPLRFVPITPCRIADTRNPAGPFGGPIIGGGAIRNFTVSNSACGIPPIAEAFSLNVTVVPQGSLGFMTIVA